MGRRRRRAHHRRHRAVRRGGHRSAPLPGFALAHARGHQAPGARAASRADRTRLRVAGLGVAADPRGGLGAAAHHRPGLGTPGRPRSLPDQTPQTRIPLHRRAVRRRGQPGRDGCDDGAQAASGRAPASAPGEASQTG